MMYICAWQAPELQPWRLISWRISAASASPRPMPAVLLGDQRREPAALGQRRDECLGVRLLAVEIAPVLARELPAELRDAVADGLLIRCQTYCHWGMLASLSRQGPVVACALDPEEGLRCRSFCTTTRSRRTPRRCASCSPSWARPPSCARCRSPSRGPTGTSPSTRSAASRRSSGTDSRWPSRTPCCASSRPARATRTSIPPISPIARPSTGCSTRSRRSCVRRSSPSRRPRSACEPAAGSAPRSPIPRARRRRSQPRCRSSRPSSA